MVSHPLLIRLCGIRIHQEFHIPSLIVDREVRFLVYILTTCFSIKSSRLITIN